MKHIYIFCLFVLPIYVFGQNPLRTLESQDSETDILLGISPLIDITSYQDKAINTYAFYQAYKAIEENDRLQRLNVAQSLKAQEKESYFSNIVPLAILNCEYETLRPSALQNGSITSSDGISYSRTTNAPIFDKHSLFLASPLRISHKGVNISYRLPADNVLNTTGKNISTIEIDFDDNQGFRTIQTDQDYPVQYLSEGEKHLNTRITLSDGSQKQSESIIKITYSNEDVNDVHYRAVTQFTSTNVPAAGLLAYGEANNYKGIGEYDIYLSPDNVLDKPIFLVDGFDFDDSRNIQSIYELLNFEDGGDTSNLADLVRAEGFDIVILNFPVYTREEDNEVIDGGVDYIERNAMLLVELIQMINGQKIGNEPNVVIGPSMGGLISRYALNYMENQSLAHDTRLWISFDAPHLGANVPIGFQHLFNYMAYGLQLGGLAGDQSIEELQPVVQGMLKSPAARQMLTDQFEPHLASGSNVEFDNSLRLPMAHPFKDIFYNSMNSLTASGFPENLRKVSIINGSGNGSPYPDKNGVPIVPGRQILNTSMTVIDNITDATFRVSFTPEASSTNEISYLFIDSIFICFCDLTADADSQAFSYSNGIDAGSGGLFNIAELSGEFGTSDPMIAGFLDAMQTDYFNFIPSISALALQVTDGEIDWFHVPSDLTSARAVNDITPFDAWYVPDDNEPHVTLTQGNVEFALNEILQGTLNINEPLGQDYIKVEKNPISNELTLLSSRTHENAKVTITDMTGKTIMAHHLQLSGYTSIPVNVDSGLYILNVETENGMRLTSKLVVR